MCEKWIKVIQNKQEIFEREKGGLSQQLIDNKQKKNSIWMEFL